MVIITAAGESGMPQNAGERIDHASRMVDAAVGRGIDLSDIYVDPLMFPISVNTEFGKHVFDAIRTTAPKDTGPKFTLQVVSATFHSACHAGAYHQ